MRLPHNRYASYSFFFVFFASINVIHLMIPRWSSFSLGLVYSIAFGFYIWIATVDKPDIKTTFWLGLLVRASLLLGLPVLSDDYFRFLWDGQLIKMGISPYQYLPSEINLNAHESLSFLFSRLNSPHYHSVYLPLHQGLFFLSSFGQSVLSQVNIMRLAFILSDVLSFYLIGFLIKSNKKQRAMRLFFLNPLIILEFTGNLHIEGIAITLILLMLVMLKNRKDPLSGAMMGLAIGIKLLPAILLPSIAWHFRWKRSILWGIAVGLLTILSLSPLLIDGSYKNVLLSLSLYQQKFEFNASVYYLIREIGYLTKGYNMIAVYGPLLSRLSVVLILMITFWASFRRWPIVQTLLFSWTIYLALSTTIHPWYALPLVPLGLIAGYHYPIVWSFVIFTTYFGYTANGYSTPYLWISIEYILVYSILIYELIQKNTSLGSRTDRIHDDANRMRSNEL